MIINLRYLRAIPSTGGNRPFLPRKNRPFVTVLRLNNLAPIWEPIAWFTKPYQIGGTIADNILVYQVGAMNLKDCQIDGSNPTNLLEFGFRREELSCP